MVQRDYILIDGATIARVIITLPNNLHADRITLVGDFNDWNTTSHPFHRNEAGKWTISIDLETRRAYQFRYLADNKHWMNETESDAWVHNVYGSGNSVIITDPDFKPHSNERNP